MITVREAICMSAGQVELLTEISNILPIPVNISLSTAISFLLPLVTGERARRVSESNTRDSAPSARATVEVCEQTSKVTACLFIKSFMKVQKPIALARRWLFN